MPKEFKPYTKQELEKKLKKQNLLILIKVFVIFLMVILAVFSTIENGVSTLTFLPLFFIPILVVMINDAKKLKKDINKYN